MLATWSATQIAFLTIAVMQAVFAIIWSIGASLISNSRLALWHWAAWSALSCVTWIVLAAHFESPPLAGVLVGVIGSMALQHGIGLFIGRTPRYPFNIALVIAVIAVAELPTPRPVQAIVNFGVLSCITALTAIDLYRHARNDLRFRLPVLLAAPMGLGALGYGSRSLQALLAPETVSSAMESNSALNLGGALSYIALVLVLHAVLVTLVVARLVSELRRLSRHDALTGLLNRRAMEELLSAEMEANRRGNTPFVVMMLDLDHFKRINDQFGHPVGDAALKHVATLLSGALGPADRLARFGGEEFVLLLPQSKLGHARPVAERLRELLVAAPLLHSTGVVCMSISIGVAEWLGTDEDISHLLSRADAALFQAKMQGRNRVVTAIPHIAAGTAFS